MKKNVWYNDERGVGFKIIDKYISKGKTHYNVIDQYGERLNGLKYDDIKHWKEVIK